MQGIRSNILLLPAVVSVGVLISLNGETILNNNKSRISVYDFDAIDQDDDISSSALRCQSELSTSDVKDTTNGCLVGAGDSPVTCEHPSQNRIATGGAGITRGWKARRIHNEDGYRALYLTRRTQTPEEGYYNCHMLTLYQDYTSSTLVSHHLARPSEHTITTTFILISSCT